MDEVAVQARDSFWLIVARREPEIRDGYSDRGANNGTRRLCPETGSIGHRRLLKLDIEGAELDELLGGVGC